MPGSRLGPDTNSLTTSLRKAGSLRVSFWLAAACHVVKGTAAKQMETPSLGGWGDGYPPHNRCVPI